MFACLAGGRPSTPANASLTKSPIPSASEHASAPVSPAAGVRTVEFSNEAAPLILLENPTNLIISESADRPAGTPRMGTVLGAIVSSGTCGADDKSVSAHSMDPVPAAAGSGVNNAADRLDPANLPPTSQEPAVISEVRDDAEQSVILIPLAADHGPIVVSSSSTDPRCVEEEILVKTDQSLSLQDPSIDCERDRNPLMVSVALENRDAVSLHPSPNENLDLDTQLSRCAICNEPTCDGACADLPCQDTVKSLQQIAALDGDVPLDVGGNARGRVDQSPRDSGETASVFYGGALQATHGDGGDPALLMGEVVDSGEGRGLENIIIKKVLVTEGDGVEGEGVSGGESSKSRERTASGGSACSSQGRSAGKRGRGEVSVKRKRGDSSSDGGCNYNCVEKSNYMTLLMERANISHAQLLVLMEHFKTCHRANLELLENAKATVRTPRRPR